MSELNVQDLTRCSDGHIRHVENVEFRTIGLSISLSMKVLCYYIWETKHF